MKPMFLLVWMPLAAGAQGSQLPRAFEPCVALRRDAERLACFDRAVADLHAGKVDDAAASPESQFGAREKSDTKRDELKQISGSVESMRRSDDGMIVLTLDNGQVWRQQDSNVTLTIDPGDPVTVERASLGTFRITDKRGRSARFKRLR